MSSRTKYIQPVLSLDKPFRSCLGLTWIRQVDREPDKFARVFSQSLLFHPCNRVCRLFFASCGKVHLGTAPHEVKCDVQTDTRATGWAVSSRACQPTKSNTGFEMMTYLAPVTMATRSCKSSRSFSGEIFDVELPICNAVERKAGDLCHN